MKLLINIVFLCLFALICESYAYDSKCIKLFFAGDYNKAILEGKKDIKRNPKDFESRMCLGSSYLRSGEIDLSLEQFLLAEKLVNTTEDILTTYNFLGDIYGYKGDDKSALLYLNRLLSIATNNNNTEWQSVALNSIASIHGKNNDTKKAIEYYIKSAELVNENDRPSRYNGIAMSYVKMKNYDKSIEYMLKAIELDERTGDYRGSAIHTLNLGYIYDKATQFKEAEKALAEGTDKIVRVGDKMWEAYAYGYWGSHYKYINDVNQAMKYYNKSLVLAKDIGATSIVNDITNAINELSVQ